MDTLPHSVAAWMREKGFTLGEQQPRPVLAATGAGALPPVEQGHHTEQKNDSQLVVSSKDRKSEEDEV
jgi:hypothetical protein